MTTCLYDAGAFPMRSPLRCCRGDSDSFVAMQGQSVHLGLHIPILLNNICSCWLTLHQKTPWNERPKQHPIHSSFPQQVHQKCQGIFQWRSASFLHHSMGQAVHWHFLLDRSEGAPKRSEAKKTPIIPRSFGELSTVWLACWFYSSYPPHHIKFLLVLLRHLDLRCINRTSWMAYHSMLTNHPLSIIYLPFQWWKPHETHIYCLIPL